MRMRYRDGIHEVAATALCRGGRKRTDKDGDGIDIAAGVTGVVAFQEDELPRFAAAVAQGSRWNQHPMPVAIGWSPFTSSPSQCSSTSISGECAVTYPRFPCRRTRTTYMPVAQRNRAPKTKKKLRALIRIALAGTPQRSVVLDIEGTTSPISFVTDVLFPYARDNVRTHLDATYSTRETKDDIALLRAQVEQDLAEGVAGAVPVPPDGAGKDRVVDALVANVEAMIAADRKTTSLKQLQVGSYSASACSLLTLSAVPSLEFQGHIWRTGFECQEIKGVVFDDVPPALERWHASGIKVLAPTKRDARSYYEIWQTVGVDRPSQILFLTDVCQEATAAQAAGLEVLISIRPGNAPLPAETHGFGTVESFAEILT
ncbi:putative bifunctional methylthioribulose-1-phosphate dehydratase/enolase-phosphatase E1 [Zea mays]|uniref:Putative bifunctional methylthioribulose-1-phosphate dehydratase/enolase-phosphatase E1 n=1 Tax=Zea mays TaxID=4577 RepID=A0A3L6FCT3_MAIZE|nr:putative bifunctional methylthioribulose-1-phosphate dehydratase/enolase-phosphatase E1 [Zea mays]